MSASTSEVTGVATGAPAGTSGTTSTNGAGAGGVESGGAAPREDAGTAVTPSPDDDLDAPGKCGSVTQMAENMRQPVDIIFGVDTTGSMAEEIAFIEENMNAFSQQISDAGIDVRVILIAGQKEEIPPVFQFHVNGVCIAAPLGSGNCPDDSNLPRYAHVAQLVSDWDMLQLYIDAYPRYREYLREGSFKTFVSISDGDIAANPVVQQPINSADAFIAAVEALEPGSTMWSRWRYSGIYGFTSCGFVGGDVGVVHAELVERTQGVAGDLCLQDFAPVFDDLARQVVDVAALACDWAIPPPPDDETFDPDKTNVELGLDGVTEALGRAGSTADCGDREGWHYDDENDPRKVVACPATCTRIQSARDARVDLLFGCEGFVLPPLI